MCVCVCVCVCVCAGVQHDDVHLKSAGSQSAEQSGLWPSGGAEYSLWEEEGKDSHADLVGQSGSLQEDWEEDIPAPASPRGPGTSSRDIRDLIIPTFIVFRFLVHAYIISYASSRSAYPC